MYHEQLLQQHKKLWALIHSIEALQTAAGVQKDGAQIARELSQLSGILNIHLASEDKYLYPALQKDPTPQIRQTAQRFAQEMGKLAEDFKRYRTRFLTASTIQADPQTFLQETRQVFQALSHRLQQEDKELYPLLKE